MLFFGVTPCVGVWIEIAGALLSQGRSKVTPCVGVWIEILNNQPFQPLLCCHSLRGSVD